MKCQAVGAYCPSTGQKKRQLFFISLLVCCCSRLDRDCKHSVFVYSLIETVRAYFTQ